MHLGNRLCAFVVTLRFHHFGIPAFAMILGCLLGTPHASALPVTWQVDGVVTNSSFGVPSQWSVGGGVVGSPVSVTYTFESSTPNSLLPANANQAWYQNSISSMTVSVNGITNTYAPSSSKIIVLDNFTPTMDRYNLEALGAGNTSVVKLDFIDNAGLAHNSNALPTSINLPAYPSPNGRIEGPGGFFSPVVYFNITSVTVPEPASFGILSVFLLGGRRRHRSFTR